MQGVDKNLEHTVFWGIGGKIITVRDRMFLGMQDFYFCLTKFQILSKFAKIFPTSLGNIQASEYWVGWSQRPRVPEVRWFGSGVPSAWRFSNFIHKKV